jgi:hypothetical protein
MFNWSYSQEGRAGGASDDGEGESKLVEHGDN